MTLLALAFVVSGCATGGTAGPSAAAVPQATASGPAAVTPMVAAGSAAPPSAAACTPSTSQSAALADLARRGPSAGVWVGMNLDWAAESVSDVTHRLGSAPAAVVSFVSFPLTADDVTNLQAAANQARGVGAVLVVTLQPWGGLSSVTDQAAADVAQQLAAFGTQGVATIVRFAHEMNGSWYPWSQDPAGYVAAFHRVATVVHATAPTAAMLWAPNQGEGYPYSGGRYQAAPGSPAAKALDTNGNSHLDAGDDPYAPYWPGAADVDWVGMSLYHWGTTYPWGANTVPAARKFGQMISGDPTAGGATVPDFYAGYAQRYDKPLAIVETAALYRPGGGGATEADIKTAWLGQVFSSDTRSRFPLIRMVNWFEWRKLETEVKAVVDWRVTADPVVRTAFLAAMSDGFHLGPAVPPAMAGPGCAPP